MNTVDGGKYRVVEREQRQVLQLTGNENCYLSMMDPLNPDMPDTLYSKVMLQPLVFLPAARDVLLIGLGGGQQAKFLHRYFPSINIVAVEIDPIVVDLARSHFLLPEDEKLRVVVRDAAVYIHEHDGECDLIMSDAYKEGDQVVEALHTEEFYRACHRKLRPDGIMTVNIFRPRSAWVSAFIATLRDVFPYWQFHVLTPEQGVVVLWKNPPLAAPEALRARAAELDAIADIGFTGFVDAFQRERDGG